MPERGKGRAAKSRDDRPGREHAPDRIVNDRFMIFFGRMFSKDGRTTVAGGQENVRQPVQYTTRYRDNQHMQGPGGHASVNLHFIRWIPTLPISDTSRIPSRLPVRW